MFNTFTRSFALHVLAAAWFGATTAVSAADPAVLQRGFLYEIAPFPSCHASTIVETTSGAVVAAFFGGTREKHPDVGIHVCRLIDGKWTAPVEAANGVQSAEKRFPCWNPVLFQPSQGPLMLFYKVGPSPSEWWGLLRTSTDDGKSWSEPRRLPDKILGPIKNKPVQLADGTIVCPTSAEDYPKKPSWRVHFERTSDLGATWERTSDLNANFGAIQPSVLFLGGNELEAVGRTQAGKVFSTRSHDAGRTWSDLNLTSLPNPNAGTDAVTLRDGRHLLVYNHTPKGRTPLKIALRSGDIDWQPVLDLETAPGEYSYPAVIQSRDGRVHVTYTWQRKKIAHVVINPAKLGK